MDSCNWGRGPYLERKPDEEDGLERDEEEEEEKKREEKKS